uniref:Uncharacterized protein n=1 Tax=Rhizophora mucronata TaxID=61149 RepID=A0A2P2PZZ4_RHIMU
MSTNLEFSQADMFGAYDIRLKTGHGQPAIWSQLSKLLQLYSVYQTYNTSQNSLCISRITIIKS